MDRGQWLRFDDVSVNTNIQRLLHLLDIALKARPDTRILLAQSPIVFGRKQLPEGHEQRVHPTVLTAMSSLAPYYRGAKAGVPETLRALAAREFPGQVVWAGHGLAHVDHRLLSGDAQEMSILMSCALAQAAVFVPPYNKWNATTAEICRANGIELVRFEDGWLHVAHGRHAATHPRYYLHPYDVTPAQLEAWFTA